MEANAKMDKAEFEAYLKSCCDLRTLVENVGIRFDVAALEKEYAESIGTTVDNMTDVQKQQAFINAVLDEVK